MRKLSFLLLIITFMSCDSENNFDTMKNTISKEFSTKKFLGNKIAYEKDNKINLAITNKELINSFNNYSKKVELGVEAVSFKILKIRNKNYIRFYNKDKSVSTVALLKENINNLQKLMYLGETVCTTTDCANCCGCVPDGKYCTYCDLNGNDCKRTTSGN